MKILKLLGLIAGLGFVLCGISALLGFHFYGSREVAEQFAIGMAHAYGKSVLFLILLATVMNVIFAFFHFIFRLLCWIMSER